MSYDPFARGPFPAGVRTILSTDEARGGRSLPLEVWYPATDAHRGEDTSAGGRDRYELLPGLPPVDQEAVRDAAPRPGRHPLVAFSHGFGGHRRQSTFLCTHLASHGYVVAAVDHTGNTIVEMMQLMLAAQSGQEIADPLAALRQFVELRPADVGFAIDRVAASDLGSHVDLERLGVTGHSFGGWTTLAYTARDRRIRAALPLAPAGGRTPGPTEVLAEALSFDWGRPVPTLYLVADGDSILPYAGMEDLLGRTPAPKQMVVLQNADHMHFCDRIEEVHEMFRSMPPPGEFEHLARSIRPIAELCPSEHAYLFVRGLGLAHMDAHLRGDEAAAKLLAGDVRSLLAERGVDVAVA